MGTASSGVTVQPPLPFPGSEAILAAILAGGTPALPGGLNGYLFGKPVPRNKKVDTPPRMASFNRDPNRRGTTPK